MPESPYAMLMALPESERDTIIDALSPAARIGVAADQCRGSFPEFLRHVRIRPDGESHNLIPIAMWPATLAMAAAWGTRRSSITLAQRQVGKSTTVAALMVWRAMLHGWRIGYVSKDQATSREHMDQRCEAIYLNLPGWLTAAGGRARWLTDEVSFTGGGWIRAFPSTEDAGVGGTWDMFVMDEFPEHPWGAANHAKVGPGVALGQMLLIGTANPLVAAGTGEFERLWKRAVSGELPYAPLFLGRDSRPRRGVEFYRAETAKLGAFVARAYYPEQPSDAFESPVGLVFGLDADGLRIYDERRNRKAKPCDWSECKWRIVGVDLGGGQDKHPSALVAVGITHDERHHVYGAERIREPLDTLDLHERLSRWDERGHIDAIMIPNEGGNTVVTGLRRMRTPTAGGWNAHEANKAKGRRIAHLKWLLREGRVTIGPNGDTLVEELESTFHPDPSKASTDPYAFRTPAGHHADCLDAWGYAELGALDGYPGGRPARGVTSERLADKQARERKAQRLRQRDMLRAGG